MLVVITGIVVYFSIAYGNENKLTNQLGVNLKINSIANSSVSTSILVDGEMLPEDKIEQNITIYAPNDNDIVFRISVFFCDLNGKRTYLDVLTMPNFVKIGDYFYYTKTLTKQTSTKFSQKVILPKAEDFMLFSDEIYTLNFLVESYTDKQVAINLWQEEF